MDRLTAPPHVQDAALWRAARAALGRNPVQASERAGVSVAGILAVERGRPRPASTATAERGIRIAIRPGHP